MENTLLTESAVLVAPDIEQESKGIWRTRIIEADVHGSSGYYPADVIRRDGPSAFPAGTHVYLDHPTLSDQTERPERSIREMAGVLLDMPVYEEGPDGRGLFTRVQFFEDVRDLIKARWEHVGLSIRASGEVEDTVDGLVVRSIHEGLSVDVVTRAGAGGRLVAMTESKTETTATSTPSSGGTTGKGADRPLAVEVEQLRESVGQQIGYLTEAVTKLTRLLREKQAEQDRLMQESGDYQKAFSMLMEAPLPNPSRARLLENYRPGQDLNEAVRQEQKYLESVGRETSRGRSAEKQSTGLGLTESSANGAYRRATTTDEDFSEIEAVLSGKMI